MKDFSLNEEQKNEFKDKDSAKISEEQLCLNGGMPSVV